MTKPKMDPLLGATDITPMGKKVYKLLVVKIEREFAPGHARITSKDGEVAMLVPSAHVDKRMPDAPKVAYFKAQVGSGVGSVEICDRVELPEEKRW